MLIQLYRIDLLNNKVLLSRPRETRNEILFIEQTITKDYTV
jgi:hypothetical protein